MGEIDPDTHALEEMAAWLDRLSNDLYVSAATKREAMAHAAALRAFVDRPTGYEFSFMRGFRAGEQSAWNELRGFVFMKLTK